MDLTIALVTSPFVLILGACIGSFLNVVIYRLPAEISLISPPSRCPHCLHRLGKTENVPVLGWLWLRGRCRWCKAPISPRYPLIEAVTAILFVAVFWHFQFTLATLGYWVLISWLLALALIDLDTMILPGSLTKSGLILGLGFQGIVGWQVGQLPQHLMGGISSAVLGIWLFDLILIAGSLILGQQAMGGGDPKLAAMIGAWLGWRGLLVTAFIACAVGTLIGGGAMILGRMRQGTPMPFGPFLALGAVLTVFWGSSIVSAYLHLFFPTL